MQFLFYFKTYYDHIIPSKFVDETTITNFPMVAFALALQGHSLPCRVKMNGHLSRRLRSFAKSIVAGCTSSTSLAKLKINWLLNLMFEFCASYPEHVVD